MFYIFSIRGVYERKVRMGLTALYNTWGRTPSGLGPKQNTETVVLFTVSLRHLRSQEYLLGSGTEEETNDRVSRKGGLRGTTNLFFIFRRSAVR